MTNDKIVYFFDAIKNSDYLLMNDRVNLLLKAKKIENKKEKVF